jgi:very-short-patch-repair endonuclease
MTLTERARDLRSNMTEAEKRLWRYLRNRQLQGHKFYRQYPIPPYYVDFLCRDKKLIIEADGGQHSENRSDEKRTKYLENKEYKVLRYWNNDILENTEGVMKEILGVLNSLTPTLSLKGEGEADEVA